MGESMIDRRFVTLFLITFGVFSFSGFLWFKLFYLEKETDSVAYPQDSDGVPTCAYEEIDMVLPVQAFLNRGAISENLSMVRRVLVNQWIYYNQQELIKLIMYAQGATTFPELKKAFDFAMEKEPKNSAISFVRGSLNAIEKNPELIAHVNKSLREGFSSEIHQLRGRMMEVEQTSKQYRKLKIEYRKALDRWIDEKHGQLLDELITTV